MGTNLLKVKSLTAKIAARRRNIMIKQARIRNAGLYFGLIKIASAWSQMFKATKPLLKFLKNQGVKIQRTQPRDPAMLAKPWQTNLPKNLTGSNYDAATNTIQIAKGKLRPQDWLTSGVGQGGTNYPTSTLWHESGHYLNDVYAGHKTFKPRPGRGPLPENHPIRALEVPVQELQANNAALQTMQQFKAPQPFMDWYKRTRENSYKTYLRDAQQQLAKSNWTIAQPQYAPHLEAWNNIAKLPGYTPDYRTADLVRQISQF